VIDVVAEVVTADAPQLVREHADDPAILRDEGNASAKAMLNDVFEVTDRVWRGIGTTEKSVRRIREALEGDGFEVMVFHTSGAGGPTMDSIAADRDVAAVLDLSLTEMVDTLFGGLCAGGPDRGRAGLAKGVPTIIAPGNVDFIIGGPLEAAQAQFPGRRYHVHNPALTAVRTNIEDLKTIADHLAGLVADAKGPVRVFVPLGGFSNHDSVHGHIHEPDLPAPFADYLRSVLPEGIPLQTRACHFNDPEFADAIIEATRALVREREPA